MNMANNFRLQPDYFFFHMEVLETQYTFTQIKQKRPKIDILNKIERNTIFKMIWAGISIYLHYSYKYM